MMQLKKGMMVRRQFEQTTESQWGKTVQQRVVISTRMIQEPETHEGRFYKGMRVGSAGMSGSRYL